MFVRRRRGVRGGGSGSFPLILLFHPFGLGFFLDFLDDTTPRHFEDCSEGFVIRRALFDELIDTARDDPGVWRTARRTRCRSPRRRHAGPFADVAASGPASVSETIGSPLCRDPSVQLGDPLGDVLNVVATITLLGEGAFDSRCTVVVVPDGLGEQSHLLGVHAVVDVVLAVHGIPGRFQDPA